MQQNLISDASVSLPQAVANTIIPDFGSLPGGMNWDFSGSGNMGQGGAFSNQNTLPSTNIDNSVQEAARIPGGSDQTEGNSLGNINTPDQANNFP